MKAILIAGGRGERLKPLTDKLPKAMVKVAGKPILEHIINSFKNHGVREFIVSLCYLPAKITSYFGDGSKLGVKINYIFEQENVPLGTAGAILGAKSHIKDTFIVAYADILRNLNIRQIIEYHKKNKSFATIAVYKNSSIYPKSLIEFDNDYRVIRFVERPGEVEKKPALPAGRQKEVWSNASFYILEPEIFNFIQAGGKSDFGRNIFPKLLESKKKIYAFISSGYFADIGDRGKLSRARKTFKPFSEDPDNLQLHAR